MHIAILLIAALFILPQTAHAADAYTNTTVNLRAGPDGGYPVVDTIQRGEQVELLGCVVGYQWCEVETRSDERGWVYAHYLDTRHTGSSGQSLTIIQTNGSGIKVITFNPRNYWSRYYRTKYFYPERDRWLPPETIYYYNYNDDHYHGHGKPPRPRPQPVPPPVEEAAPPKFGPIPMPSRKEYNPLCPIGQTTC